jgi:hypothetical protein
MNYFKKLVLRKYKSLYFPIFASFAKKDSFCFALFTLNLIPWKVINLI